MYIKSSVLLGYGTMSLGYGTMSSGYGTMSLRGHFLTFRDNRVVTTSMVKNLEKYVNHQLHNCEDTKPSITFIMLQFFCAPCSIILKSTQDI
jgi:hypothetical protein